MKISCILLASGSSTRFNGNKLLSCFNGQLLVEHILRTLPYAHLSQTAIVTCYPEIESLAKSYGISSVFNADAKQGVSTTIRVGLSFLDKADGYMFCVCDQPFCSQESILKIMDTFHHYPQNIIALSIDGKKGNPVIFPNHLVPELMALTSHQSGSVVINHHLDLLRLVEANNPCELLDIDTRKDWDNLNQIF